MSEKDKLAMLNAIPDKPRFMVFVLRSYPDAVSFAESLPPG